MGVGLGIRFIYIHSTILNIICVDRRTFFPYELRVYATSRLDWLIRFEHEGFDETRWDRGNLDSPFRMQSSHSSCSAGFIAKRLHSPVSI